MLMAVYEGGQAATRASLFQFHFMLRPQSLSTHMHFFPAAGMALHSKSILSGRHPVKFPRIFHLSCSLWPVITPMHFVFGFK